MEERIYFSLHLSGHSPPREVRAGHQEGRNWLVPHGLLSLLSYTLQDYLPCSGTSHSG